VKGGAVFTAKPGSPYATPEQLRRALEDDQDEAALESFSDFHRTATFGIEFKDYLQSSSDSVLGSHEVYDAVAKRIREHDYDGVVVIWDEFGFAIEELLRDEQRGVRSLGQEVMKFQTFLENACGSQEVGKRILFLGFTHVGLSEYGSRANLGQTELNRLQTVVDRFRTPAINIRLSITETEGYHLLSGMLLRTPAGSEVLGKHPPRLFALNERMPSFNPWSSFAAHDCFADIVSACYPLHPAAATTLLILSDQIAQVSRTSFYFLHSAQEGGVAAGPARTLGKIGNLHTGAWGTFELWFPRLKSQRNQLGKAGHVRGSNRFGRDHAALS
jgi:hypothetical protein